MKVKILGTEYEVIKDAEEKDYPQLKKCDGFTDFSIKRIVVANFDKDESGVDDIDWYKKKVLRHELVHAFIHESGLAENCDWARNEELTDWIAIQFEKILGVFIELQCIDSIGVDVNVFDRQSNNPINDPINSPKVKVAKASIKDNTEIINEIGKSINKIPIKINLNNLAKGGIIGGDG
ncbi:MAG: hypothetical protein Q4C23_02955 [Mycoplasmatota bacterium]|nr:hypothetical protein [Mycoplasmatota bacterium]